MSARKKVIDSIHSLAFSVQAKPGVYAVLIGSGVSRTAGIPTGWEITLDLIRKLARLYGEEASPEPEAWYRGRFDRDPDYSELLHGLAKTPAERQLLLRGYFEPTDADVEQGQKQATKAHHAIAALAARGFIKAIVTTNFDRLMEGALSAAGVEPTVLSTPDQIQGALPLIHTPCCVFKVHGDYLDPRIRNTETELVEYPEQTDRLLDQVFDEFGLIVCGWSGDWDEALRRALERSSSHRFTTYWTTRRQPSETAERLIRHRHAEVVEIGDADTFFQKVNEYVASIEDFSNPHPLSVEAAVASLKRYLSEPKYRIQLSDLIADTVQQVIDATSQESFSTAGPEPTSESVTRRVRAYDAASSKLTAMAIVGGAWADEEHYSLWKHALVRLSAPRPTTGGRYFEVWRELQPYPATLLLYALGLGSVEANRLEFINRLLTTKIPVHEGGDVAAVEILPPVSMFSRGQRTMQVLEGMERHRYPLNDWIQRVLRGPARHLLRDDNHFTRIFDKLEILVALSAGRIQEWSGRYWAPPGCFCWKWNSRNPTIAEIMESTKSEQDDSPFVRSGIFGKNAEECRKRLDDLQQFVANISWH